MNESPLMTRCVRHVILACILVVSAAALYWHYELGPEQMLGAIRRGDIQKIGTLANLGINPDSDASLNGGYIHCAAAMGQTQSMAKLLDLGANVNRLDGYGTTPLDCAIRFNQIDSFRWLLDHGADPSIKDRDRSSLKDYVITYVPEQRREEFFTEVERISIKSLK